MITTKRGLRRDYDAGVLWAQTQLENGRSIHEVLTIIDAGEMFDKTPFDVGARTVCHARRKEWDNKGMG